MPHAVKCLFDIRKYGIRSAEQMRSVNDMKSLQNCGFVKCLKGVKILILFVFCKCCSFRLYNLMLPNLCNGRLSTRYQTIRANYEVYALFEENIYICYSRTESDDFFFH